MTLTPAPRNKTITLNEAEMETYASRAITLEKKSKLADILDRTIWQDTFEALKFLPADFADLVIVDPPYNLTKKFGTKEFKRLINHEQNPFPKAAEESLWI